MMMGGIPEHELTRVFQPFYRVEATRSRETGGIGLELAIAQLIVQAHEGELTLSNQVEGRPRTRVTLPIYSSDLNHVFFGGVELKGKFGSGTEGVCIGKGSGIQPALPPLPVAARTDKIGLRATPRHKPVETRAIPIREQINRMGPYGKSPRRWDQRCL